MTAYDRQGQPISIEKYAQLLHDMEYKRVAETTVDTRVGPVWISTVWLGIDHNWFGGGPPIIFETMVFDQGDYTDSPYGDLDCERYATEEAALAGHDQMVCKVREMVTL